jgi:hypothetical protein
MKSAKLVSFSTPDHVASSQEPTEGRRLVDRPYFRSWIRPKWSFYECDRDFSVGTFFLAWMMIGASRVGLPPVLSRGVKFLSRPACGASKIQQAPKFFSTCAARDFAPRLMAPQLPAAAMQRRWLSVGFQSHTRMILTCPMAVLTPDVILPRKLMKYVCYTQAMHKCLIGSILRRSFIHSNNHHEPFRNSGRGRWKRSVKIQKKNLKVACMRKLGNSVMSYLKDRHSQKICPLSVICED